MHLIVDAYGDSRELLLREDLLKTWLLKAAEVSGMTVYGEPEVKDYPFPYQDSTALSAVVFLGQSSITVHTYPEFSFVYLDIFSCLQFRRKEVIDFVKSSFKVTSCTIVVLNRGIDSMGKPIQLEVLE